MGLFNFLFNRGNGGFSVSNQCINDVMGFSCQYADTRKTEIYKDGRELYIDWDEEGHLWFIWKAMKDAGYNLSKRQIEAILDKFSDAEPEENEPEELSVEQIHNLIQKACPEETLNSAAAECLYYKVGEYQVSHKDSEVNKEDECLYICNALKEHGVSVSRENVWKILSRLWWEPDYSLWDECITFFVPWKK